MLLRAGDRFFQLGAIPALDFVFGLDTFNILARLLAHDIPSLVYLNYPVTKYLSRYLRQRVGLN